MMRCVVSSIVLMVCLHSFVSGSIHQLFNSSCSRQMNAMSQDDVSNIERVVPPHSYMKQLHQHMKHRPTATVLLLCVDMPTHMLALNHIESIRLSNPSLVPFVIAYEAGVCEKMALFVSGGCYFDEQWSKDLVAYYVSIPKSANWLIPVFWAMLSRMMGTIYTLCGGYNVFLSDTDVIFYRDPMAFVLRDVDVMITSTYIPQINNEDWGAFYFPDHPTEFATINNGVVFYRSTDVVRSFHLTMAADSIQTCAAIGDRNNGFLQTFFNKQLVKHNLVLSLCSGVSDPVTKKFATVSPLLGGNKAGECYDCYYANLNWTTDVIRTPENGTTHLPLKIGVFPTERFISHCVYKDVPELKGLLATAAVALKAGDLSGWGWGEDQRVGLRRLQLTAHAHDADTTTNGTHASRASAHFEPARHKRRLSYLQDAHTRPLSVHLNCIKNNDLMDKRFVNKEILLKRLNSWYL